MLTPLNDFLQNNMRGKVLVEWTTQAPTYAFEVSKVSLVQATFLVHPRASVELALFVDVSDCSVRMHYSITAMEWRWFGVIGFLLKKAESNREQIQRVRSKIVGDLFDR